MSSRKRGKRVAVLDSLRDAQVPVTSAHLTGNLAARGYPVSERTVRQHLSGMQAEGMAESDGRRGHRLTGAGRAELKASTVLDRVGRHSARIDELAYRMSFDPATRRGTVVVNTSLVSREALVAAGQPFGEVFARGYAMGELVALLGPGERLGEFVVPEGRTGLCTVSSVTINGVLLKNGIPARSRFDGLLEFFCGRAGRFVQLITCEGTTVDALEAFTRGVMTDHLGAISSGNGRIGASFLEIPEESRDAVGLLAEKLQCAGMGAVVAIGRPSHSLLGISVGKGSVGLVANSGLNPTAVLAEKGYRTESHHLAGLLDYQLLFHYSELLDRLADMPR